MSKSKKKQQARKREQAEHEPLAPTLETPEPEEALEDEEPALALPEKKPQPLNEGLYERVVEAATRVGQAREEGDRLAYLYNADTLSMKYLEPGDDPEAEPGTVMVAAFRQGVVYQVSGETQLVYKPGDWEQAIAELAKADVLEPDEAEDAEEDQ